MIKAIVMPDGSGIILVSFFPSGFGEACNDFRIFINDFRKGLCSILMLLTMIFLS